MTAGETTTLDLRADDPAATAGGDEPVQTLRSPFAPEQIVDRLNATAKLGRLPEFEVVRAAGGVSPPVVRMAVFGAPYDHELLVTIRPGPTGGSLLVMENRLKRKLPVIMAIVFLLTIWPGVWLTHSMLVTYFSWYRINTWWWYLPLMLLSAPVLWKQFKKSEVVAQDELAQLMQKLRSLVEAETD